MFSFSGVIINPMLEKYYNLPPEKSVLFGLVGAIAFILTTPIAFMLRRANFKRRSIIYLGLFIHGTA